MGLANALVLSRNKGNKGEFPSSTELRVLRVHPSDMSEIYQHTRHHMGGGGDLRLSG